MSQELSLLSPLAGVSALALPVVLLLSLLSRQQLLAAYACSCCVGHLVTQLPVSAALAERRDLPRWMNLVDLILVATPFPHCRKLRMLHQPEQTMTLTAATAFGVTLFFLLYLGLLMAFFTAGRLCWLPRLCTQICQP